MHYIILYALYSLLCVHMSVMNFQVFLGGLLNRARVVFTEEKTMFLNHECRDSPSQMVAFTLCY